MWSGCRGAWLVWAEGSELSEHTVQGLVTWNDRVHCPVYTVLLTAADSQAWETQSE